ncbi:MAG TPA: DUF6428 family protein [Ensifer sp.]|jgi:hypothetical protein|uniref:DUF6428 family protein n=1 Tax=Ensifer sp. TaxID=1872086 RepID=UPI002E0FF98F|nr:DUF6428 family protein [Ensifer sp.]
MTILDKPKISDHDLNLAELLDALASTGDVPLVFHYDGRPVKSGYHVTEVKAGQFSALDCGANPEAWSEIFVQLWDVEEAGRTHLSAGKFSAIVRKVSDHVRLDATARLTFEVSDGLRPMQLYCAGTPLAKEDGVHVHLEPRAASCKPRDRWLAEAAAAGTCCGPKAASSACCT